MAEPSSFEANLRGIGAMLLAQIVFVSSDALVKLASASIPSTEIMGVRGLFAILFMGVIIWRMNGLTGFRHVLRPIVLLRGLLEVTIAVLFLAAIATLTLADISVYMQTTPLFLAALAAFLLKEAVGPARWLAVLAGFAGVVMVAQPGAAAPNLATGLAILCAFVIAVRDLVTRMLPAEIPSTVVAFALTVLVCGAGWAGTAVETWKPISAEVLLYLLGSAFFVSVANILLVVAFRGTDVSVVSPFRYSAVLWSVSLGYLIWGDLPNRLAAAGIALIVLAGLFVMHGETKAFRASRRKK